jgi:integration host factor subunit alpha
MCGLRAALATGGLNALAPGVGTRALETMTAEGHGRTTTRADLLEAVHRSCPSLSRNQAREVFEMALGEICDALVRGEPVKLRSFGNFAVRSKRERIGRNPRTGVEAPIAPRRVVTFRPSPVLLGRVNGNEPADFSPD